MNNWRWFQTFQFGKISISFLFILNVTISFMTTQRTSSRTHIEWYRCCCYYVCCFFCHPLNLFNQIAFIFLSRFFFALECSFTRLPLLAIISYMWMRECVCVYLICRSFFVPITSLSSSVQIHAIPFQERQ